MEFLSESTLNWPNTVIKFFVILKKSIFQKRNFKKFKKVLDFIFMIWNFAWGFSEIPNDFYLKGKKKLLQKIFQEQLPNLMEWANFGLPNKNFEIFLQIIKIQLFISILCEFQVIGVILNTLMSFFKKCTFKKWRPEIDHL